MEKNYTLKQCKKDMIYMWKWLAKTRKDKIDFIKFLEDKRAESTYVRFLHMSCNCPCCEFTEHGYKGEIDNNNCKNCPIVWKNNTGFVQCDKLGSEFRSWRGSPLFSDERRLAAEAIVKLAEVIDINADR